MSDRRPDGPRSTDDSRRRAVATGLGLLVGAVAYGLTLIDYSTRFGRTANSLGYASGFFDAQGRAFLDGHLDVPPGTLGIEGFLEDGREYMYFGPWPAILRLPILQTTTEYDGRLTVASMALAFVLLAVMVTKLTWLVRDLMRPDEAVTRFEAISMGIFIALATGGTSLTYIAALPWVYHEVYAWAVPLALGAMYWMLRVLRSPDPSAIAWLLAFDVATALTRTTGGWAVCLATVGVGVWLLTGRVHPDRRRAGAAVVAGGLLMLFVGIVLNWVKFRHPYLFPLEDQVWTQLNEHRRDALEANGGTITGPQFFPTAFMAYFRLDGVRVVDYFPFVTLPAHPAPSYAGAFVDQSYRTGSVTAFMPWLLVLTVIAVVVLFRPGVDAARRWLRLPLVTGVLITGGVMAYGYFAHRYTAEFVPALIMGGAVGTCALTRWLQQRRTAIARAGLVLAGLLTAWSVAASMLVGYSAAAFTGGGPHLARYLDVQHRLSPNAQADLVTFSDDLPSGGDTDDLWIRGDCEALYLNTGDTYDTWQLVERRSLVIDLRVAEGGEAGRVQVARALTDFPKSVWLQLDGRGRARVQLVNETGTFSGGWFDLVAPREIRIGIRDLAELGYAEVSSNPGGYVGLMRTFEWGDDWISSPTELEFVQPPAGELAALGVEMSTGFGLAPPLCTRIAATARGR